MKSLRREMELIVVSQNAPLRPVVNKMDWILLLRNIHPIYRGAYAHILFKEDEITKDEACEFTKIVGYGTN